VVAALLAFTNAPGAITASASEIWSKAESGIVSMAVLANPNFNRSAAEIVSLLWAERTR
jgi:hypothetical protein